MNQESGLYPCQQIFVEALFYITNNMGPIYPLYVRDADGNIMYENGMKVYDANQTNFIRPNIVGNAVRDNEVNSKRNYSDMISGKFGLVVTPIKGLSVTGNVGLMNENSRYNTLYSQFGSSSSTDGLTYVSHDRYFAVNTQLLAEYKTDFGGTLHNLEALAGYELYKLKIQSLEGQNDRLYDPFIGELGNADGTKSKKRTIAPTNINSPAGISTPSYILLNISNAPAKSPTPNTRPAFFCGSIPPFLTMV